ncbi:MAG TPA: hypothetical protein VD973_07125 [Symbiobacteriaceae bacterium]|nr:hypothetical protein [Symbiobacteriaceae bacterium]
MQAKSFAVNTDKDAARLTYEVSDPKYHTMQKVTNPENVDRVRGLAERRGELQGSLKAEDYRDTARNVSGETRHGDVRSGGTSYQEARLAAEQPGRFAAWQEVQQVARETATQAAAAAATGAVIGGAISAMRNSLAVSRGEMSAGDAARATLTDAGRAAVRGGATGAGVR